MKLDQIAYYAHNDQQVEELKRSMGLLDAEWIEDVATGDVQVRTGSGVSKGHLRFNYDLGIELEILTYLDGPHWHQGKVPFRRGHTFLSHIGFHMDEGERPPEWVTTTGTLVQEMDTTEHTNDYVVSKSRTYHYEIYSVPTGPDLKFIWRKEP
jgi:hypothetical protein